MRRLSQKNQSQTNQQGVGLIETLIATLVVGFGMVAFLQLTQTNLKNTDSAYYRNQSSILVADIFDRLRANGNQAVSGDYDITYTTTTPSPGSKANTDLNFWRNAIIAALPQGESAIACVQATQICTVSIRWNDSRAIAGNNQQEFIVSSVVR